MNEQTWGIRLNMHSDYQRFKKGQTIPRCPDWFGNHQINAWQEQGLIVWSNADKKFARLNGQDMLRLLDQLSSQDIWKSEGVSINHLVYQSTIQKTSSDRRKTAKQASNTKQETDTEISNFESVYDEVMRLPPEAGPELLDLLQTNQQIIYEIAEQEKKQFQENIGKLYKMILEFSRRHEVSEFQTVRRDFEWHQNEISRWFCKFRQTEGQICLNKSRFVWHACVRKSKYPEKTEYFSKLLNAAEWVEKELVDLANQPEAPKEPSAVLAVQQIEADRIRLREKLLNGSYWIDPAKIEPERITFKIFIELEAKPISFENYKTMCGNTIRIKKRYPSPSKLAGTLNLDIDHFHIDQPIGENTEWYRFTSLTVFYQEVSAAEQAQRIWDQSYILQLFKAGKIARARFGYQEVETGFVVYLGACEESGKSWEQPDTRNSYIELLALRESLCFALDITDYRDYLGVSREYFDDERILQAMHKTRSRSKYLPEEIKRESKIWLAQHDLS